MQPMPAQQQLQLDLETTELEKLNRRNGVRHSHGRQPAQQHYSPMWFQYIPEGHSRLSRKRLMMAALIDAAEINYDTAELGIDKSREWLERADHAVAQACYDQDAASDDDKPLNELPDMHIPTGEANIVQVHMLSQGAGDDSAHLD